MNPQSSKQNLNRQKEFLNQPIINILAFGNILLDFFFNWKIEWTNFSSEENPEAIWKKALSLSLLAQHTSQDHCCVK